MTEQLRQAEVEDVEYTPATSLPTIWECHNCGAQIQVVVAPSEGKGRLPFRYVCDTEMSPGKE